MGQKFERKKQRNYLNSLIYRVAKLPLASERTKFELFANLDWIFARLAHESWMRMYSDKDSHPSRVRMFEFIGDKLPPDAAVLDLGCGYGEISAMLGELCKSVTGIDRDRAKVQHALDRYSKDNVSFVCCDALQFLSGNRHHYDVLICSHILEHLDDPAGMLSCFKDFFSYVYIELPDFDNSYLNLVRQRLNVPLNYMDEDHVYEFDRDEMGELLASLGMKIANSEFRHGVMRFWVRVL